MIYTRRDLVKSYLDAFLYANADKVLASDTKDFTTALQKAFQVNLDSLKPLASTGFNALGWAFQKSVEAIIAEQNGELEAGLAWKKLESLGEAGQRITKALIIIGETRYKLIEGAFNLLIDIIEIEWPESPGEVTSDDLRLSGFDDANRPDPMDFW